MADHIKRVLTQHGRKLQDTDFYTSAVCVNECPYDVHDKFQCMPTTNVTAETCENEIDPFTGKGYMAYGSDTVFGAFCFPNPDRLGVYITPEKYQDMVGALHLDTIQQVYGDLKAAKHVYLYSIGTCLAAAIIYNILLKFFAKILIWASIIGTGIGLIALSIFLQEYHHKNYGPDS
jgi:hypothetical protein